MKATDGGRPRVAAVVLHFRFWPGVEHCLDALREQSAALVATVVVDNASSDASAEAIRSAHPGLSVVELATNDGYAAGMNAGVAAVDGDDPDWLLLCTHDAVLDPDCLERLLAIGEADPSIGALGPLLGWRSRPDVVWSAGGALRRSGRPVHVRPRGDIASARLCRTADRDWLDGAVLLVRRTAWKAIGGFDESFFLYCEEVEWLLRAHDHGWRVVCEPSAVARQEPGQAPPYLETRNRIRLHLIRRSPLGVAAAVAAGLRAAARSALAGRRDLALLRLAAVRDGLSGRLDRARALRR
jgi:GT2 family glycosyltransferase